ncbi:Cd(II)/Pb(II)-responsive transcriptional regulator [Parahaliea mediterranea]|uniref:Cd(II)/Pb(II)-responsive transcriptional regulator n=1 Tax=Parahaliea mediterranea TaxID=651086 RepID=UPI000E2F3BA2|nr:Cd(II)/Pb(II)-responsive transcriptional regulator [Parahaliea mediterranea]
MKIGELAKQSGCSVQTIRHYEKEALLTAPARSEGNFRLYDESTLHQLLFIKHCRNLDISLPEIRRLVSLKQAPQERCDEINRLMDDHIAQVENRIIELSRLRDDLIALRHSCDQQKTVEQCGILKNLAGSYDTPTSQPKGEPGSTKNC